MPPADAARLLADGELRVLGRISAASNTTLLCETVLATEPSEVLRCVYKPIAGERPLWDFPDGTLASREFVAYLVSEALGWSVVPPTLLRDGPYGKGMVQQWIDKAEVSADSWDLVDLCPVDAIPIDWCPVLYTRDEQGEEIALIHSTDSRLWQIAVFDLVINNADRKGGHLLKDRHGKHYAIDHGICMHSEDKLRTVLWGWANKAIPEALVADIAHMSVEFDSGLSPVLAKYLADHEISALKTRIDTLIAHPVMPEPSNNRPIPWPAF
ncbi:MAG: SCO1664 family protein [Mycobacteriaceae bacterium]